MTNGAWIANTNLAKIRAAVTNGKICAKQNVILLDVCSRLSNEVELQRYKTSSMEQSLDRQEKHTLIWQISNFGLIIITVLVLLL